MRVVALYSPGFIILWLFGGHSVQGESRVLMAVMWKMGRVELIDRESPKP